MKLSGMDSTLPHLKDSGDAYWTFIDSHLPWRWIFLTSYLVGGRRVAPDAGDLSIYPFDRAPVTRKTPRWLYTINLQDFLEDRKSTRLNSSHSQISYAVFCLKKKRPLISDRDDSTPQRRADHGEGFVRHSGRRSGRRAVHPRDRSGHGAKGRDADHAAMARRT